VGAAARIAQRPCGVAVRARLRRAQRRRREGKTLAGVHDVGPGGRRRGGADPFRRRSASAQRPASKVYSGYWSFRGKIEPGEPGRGGAQARDPRGARHRDRTAYPWITRSSAIRTPKWPAFLSGSTPGAGSRAHSNTRPSPGSARMRSSSTRSAGQWSGGFAA